MKYFAKSHEWVEVDGDEAIIGISQHAAEELGDLTYVELPTPQSDIVAGDSIGVVESVKAASDVYSPISGTIIAVNDALEDDPGLINKAAESEGWLCRLSEIDLDELNELMNEEQYQKFLTSNK